MTMIQGGTPTEIQKRLFAHNIARLQYQRAFGNERPKRREKPNSVSLIDLAGTSANDVAAISLRRVL
jgi:hypothetical protein